ncbi:MAG: ABC transporter permease, partial [Aldersonia sp.]|nr:ABC transporter permease [Aldersonia sp.]
AAGSALRGTAFFDGAGVTTPLSVLGCWAVGGLALTLAPVRERALPSRD